MNNASCGAVLTPLKKISNPKGDIYHALKACENSFEGFGEAYFSTVLPGVTKGWKMHRRMTLNLIVPVGEIAFHLRSENGAVADSYCLGELNYARLTVPPGVWMAFSGVGDDLNLLLNIASISHDPNESISLPLEHFSLEQAD
jgi:dTDP-4-dehydrorhamnose 3,5-epimerase